MDDRGSDVHVHRDRTRADPHSIFNGKVSAERNICRSRGYGDLCGIRDRRRIDRRKKDEEKKIPVGTVIRKPVSAALAGGLPKDLVHMGTTLGICMAAGTLGGMMS